MTGSDLEPWELSELDPNWERIFKPSQFFSPSLGELLDKLAQGYGEQIALDERGLAASLRYLAAHKRPKDWRRALEVLAEALDNDNCELRLKVSHKGSGRPVAPASRRDSERRATEGAIQMFVAISRGVQPKNALTDAAAHYQVTTKTINKWLKQAAASFAATKRVAVTVYETRQAAEQAQPHFWNDPLNLWLERYEGDARKGKRKPKNLNPAI